MTGEARRLKNPTRKKAWQHPPSRGTLALLAAVSVASAGGTALRMGKKIRILTEGHGHTDTTATRHTPLELLIFLLLMRGDTPTGQGTQCAHMSNAARSAGGCETS